MPYKSAKQRAFMHARHPDIAARWDKTYGGAVQKGKRPMAKMKSASETFDALKGGLAGKTTKMKATVGKKAVTNYRAGSKNPTSKTSLTQRAAAANGDAKSTRRAIRTTIKQGLRTRKPNLSTKVVKTRAAKQTAAMMKKRA